jgi:hypothetical protein
MAALVWGAWSPDWALRNKVDFDGANKVILVHPEVTSLDIRQDVYSAWVDWLVLRDNMKFLPAIRYTGYDPIGGGKFTGDTYFLTNGWKLSVDLRKVAVTGVLFSDNYDTAYYTPDMQAQYPAVVATVVNTVTIQIPAVVTAAEIRSEIDANSTKLAGMPNAVWQHSFVSKLLTVAKFLGLK